jgi:stearoyl-CoA desaturase (Delta-9 desaturase)
MLKCHFFSFDSGLGITAGCHRLWAHRSYEASFAVRVFLMLCNSIACQGSIHHWVRDHRLHHKFSETETDPHNAQRGFFFAHMGWLMIKKHPKVLKAGREMDMSDVMEDPVVWFQKKSDPWLTLYMCLVMPAQVASYFWGESFLNGFFVPGALRYCFGLHVTFLVNSAAHIYGDHPYDGSLPPTENPIVAFFALGEGWHNWHHKYPFDYAASEFGISSQFNPTKLFIDFLACFGFVWGRKRATNVWRQARCRMDSEQTTKKSSATKP